MPPSKWRRSCRCAGSGYSRGMPGGLSVESASDLVLPARVGDPNCRTVGATQGLRATNRVGWPRPYFSHDTGRRRPRLGNNVAGGFALIRLHFLEDRLPAVSPHSGDDPRTRTSGPLPSDGAPGQALAALLPPLPRPSRSSTTAIRLAPKGTKVLAVSEPARSSAICPCRGSLGTQRIVVSEGRKRA